MISMWVVGLYTYASHVQASSQCASAPQHFAVQQQPLFQSQQCLDADVESVQLEEALPFHHPVWSYDLICVTGKEKEYCTHTTSDLRSGHGLGLIASPAAEARISAAFLA
jgi:hypothetical protein